MPNDSTLWYLTNRALNGRLNELLRAWAKAGASRRVAAKLLANELGVEISPPTVQKWTSAAVAELEENGEAA